jgi:hypothetical protein
MITTTENQISDSLVEKVKGLLRLANSDNQHEAELAMQRAKSLCVKYDLDLAELQTNAFDKKANEEPITQNPNFELGKRMPISQTLVTRILENFFNVEILYGGRRSYGRHLVIIGRKKDIEVAEYLNNYLNEEFLRLWRKFYSENEAAGVTLNDRMGFLHGLAAGLTDKLQESQKETENKYFEEKSIVNGPQKVEEIRQCYALTIKNLKERVKEKMHEFYPKLGTAYTRRGPRNYNAFGSGRQIGRSISLARPLGYSGGNKSLT